MVKPRRPENNIRTARLRSGLTASRIAEILGVSKATLWRWESGAAAPDVYEARRLADLFGIHPDDLFPR